ncbi:hypothetical protein [Flexivirga caeni]|uniref:Uncharacterized protein n=1 Tax=Flexivirga caeni TaxID=2294115 RepID=A0A3M9M558_9MICO|nr:hypothetical protein [Flexivirga caeni]RNI20694.1 hypothetical protein EFY87_14010 [Flexivirga caeni]
MAEQQDGHDDLEHLLRAAFAAKADGIGPGDLDIDREEFVARQLARRPGASRTRRVVAGVGILAAAAATVGVVSLALRPTQQGEPVGALAPVSTSRAVGPPTASATPTHTSSAAEHRGAAPHVQQFSDGRPLSTASGRTLTGTGVAPSSRTASGTSGTALPPTLSPTLPQNGTLNSGPYTGPVPLGDTGHGIRMLAMPDGTTWEVVARTGSSLTLRITYLPTDIEAYWSASLPGEGWQQSAEGWQFPGTAYAVSALDDKATFTVTW